MKGGGFYLPPFLFRITEGNKNINVYNQPNGAHREIIFRTVNPLL